MRRLGLVIGGVAGALVAASTASAMTFERLTAGPCAHRGCVQAAGPIEKSTPDDFERFIRASGVGEGGIVFLSSTGGEHVAGISLGKVIRKRGLDTFIAAFDPGKQAFAPADCASACVYMFLGGVQRGASDGSRIGVHQLRLVSNMSSPDGVVTAQWFMGLASEHIVQMGADPALLSLALKTPPEGMAWLGRDQMRSLRVITLDNDLTAPPRGAGVLSFFDVTR